MKHKDRYKLEYLSLVFYTNFEKLKLKNPSN